MTDKVALVQTGLSLRMRKAHAEARNSAKPMEMLESNVDKIGKGYGSREATKRRNWQP